jgi:16S rRNA (guanine1516-N2)-methyltransferase
MKLAVTYAKHPNDDLLDLAGGVADELGAPILPRGNESITKLRSRYGLDGLIVASHDGLVYHHPTGAFFFHPSMAKVRIRSLRLGELDPAVEAMGVAEGMSVLDCTLGRAADACVAAHVVGAAGRVVGLEADRVVAALTRRGLVRFDAKSPALNVAMRRVEVICADHGEYLAGLSDGAFDVVYFDPFFAETVEESQAMQELRAVGRHGFAGEPVLREALRVAAKRVVVKVRRGACPACLEGWDVAGGRRSRVEYRVREAGRGAQ